jgi:hypothetical protein
VPDRRLLRRAVIRAFLVMALLIIVGVAVTVPTSGELLASPPETLRQAAAGLDQTAIGRSQPQPQPQPDAARQPSTVPVRLDIGAGVTVQASRKALTDIPSTYLAYYVHATSKRTRPAPT